MAADRPEGPDGVEKLSSNVMNYLVWRYLQESGYGKTAKQLQYQWMGRDESPDGLPFAPNINKACLVHLAQDGLLLDHLQAEVKQIGRQYVFGPDHGRKFSVPAEEPREKKPRIRSTSRIPTNGERDLQNGSPAEAPGQRRGKGKRKSGGAERRMNGEMMDVDVNVGPTSMNDPTVAEIESPLPVIEEAPIIPTLQTGESKETATEQPRDLTPNTSFVALEEGLEMEQVKWSPHNRTALVTAGRNHMRVHKITTDVPDNGIYTQSTKADFDSEDFHIHVFTWMERGSGAFTAQETYKNELGDEMTRTKLLGFHDFGKVIRLVDPTAGAVLSLQYNPTSKLLLSLSYGEMAHVKIWQYSETKPEPGKKRGDSNFEFKFSKAMGAELFDAAWMTPTRFIVCGIGTLDVYEVVEDITLLKSIHTEQDWLQLRYDPIYEVAALMDEQRHALGILKVDGDLKIHNETFQDTHITEFAFQPLAAKPFPELDTAMRILATATDSGNVLVWNALGPLTLLHKFSMGKQATAQALAFSPDGFLLAAAGYDSLNVWKTLEGGEPKAVWKMSDGMSERWRSEPGEEEEEGWEHSLGWDADGKRIAFGLRGQIAVIRLV